MSSRSLRWRSRWRFGWYVRAVQSVRLLLRRFGSLETRFIRGLVARHNRRVLAWLRNHPPRSVLLILPRCAKRRGCRIDPGGDMTKCRECGECILGIMARLTESYGVRSLVAFRSHIAFEMARRERPDLILATACDDRIIKALRSVPENAAMLTPLNKPGNRCVDCSFDVSWFDRYLRIATGRTPKPAPAEAAAAGACPRPESNSPSS